MPKEPKPKPDYLAAAKDNLQAPHGITLEQYANRAAAAQVQATIALAEHQARTADALELANLIQARALGAFDTAEEYKATRDKIRALAGLPESTIA
ncbi:hypothetical protein SEA_VIBAKI_68 [Arthrobacter phage Vibaki]|uniref:Uncharacterized protein n=1 Tax=Arthrobacter phage Vibaki TaxID=2593333 RepID=A0A514TZ19_9CAUD|nr:hypothetical protein HYP95_gp68 [Arthrobacter phage Vibaki]QDK01948.1 hypothetical protein SEA_VIBAKI_68 [Arthrobacter phage Vibaki]